MNKSNITHAVKKEENASNLVVRRNIDAREEVVSGNVTGGIIVGTGAFLGTIAVAGKLDGVAQTGSKKLLSEGFTKTSSLLSKMGKVGILDFVINPAMVLEACTRNPNNRSKDFGRDCMRQSFEAVLSIAGEVACLGIETATGVLAATLGQSHIACSLIVNLAAVVVAAGLVALVGHAGVVFKALATGDFQTATKEAIEGLGDFLTETLDEAFKISGMLAQLGFGLMGYMAKNYVNFYKPFEVKLNYPYMGDTTIILTAPLFGFPFPVLMSSFSGEVTITNKDTATTEDDGMRALIATSLSFCGVMNFRCWAAIGDDLPERTGFASSFTRHFGCETSLPSLKDVLKGVKNALKFVGSFLAKVANNAYTTAIQVAQKISQGIANFLNDFRKDPMEGLKTAAKALLKAAGLAIKFYVYLHNPLGFAKDVVEGVVETGEKVSDWVKNRTLTGVSKIVSGGKWVAEKASAAWKGFRGLWGRRRSVSDNVPKQMFLDNLVAALENINTVDKMDDITSLDELPKVKEGMVPMCDIVSYASEGPDRLIEKYGSEKLEKMTKGMTLSMMVAQCIANAKALVHDNVKKQTTQAKIIAKAKQEQKEQTQIFNNLPTDIVNSENSVAFDILGGKAGDNETMNIRLRVPTSASLNNDGSINREQHEATTEIYFNPKNGVSESDIKQMTDAVVDQVVLSNYTKMRKNSNGIYTLDTQFDNITYCENFEFKDEFMEKNDTKIDVFCTAYGDENNFFDESKLQTTFIDQMIWPELIGDSACKDCNYTIIDVSAEKHPECGVNTFTWKFTADNDDCDASKPIFIHYNVHARKPTWDRKIEKTVTVASIEEVELPEAVGYFATKFCHGTDALEVKVSDKDNKNGVERTYTAADDCGKTIAFTQTIIIKQ
eukprot:Pgem_evm1s11072